MGGDAHQLSLIKEGDKVEYKLNSGDINVFDTSKASCEPFGFLSGQRVHTPKGEAVVIGVYDGFLWFHIDGDPGASYWEDGKTYEELITLGVYSIQAPEPAPTYQELKVGEYKIKRIDYAGKTLNILLQNENGPCPLIAIANILAMRGQILIQSKNDRVAVNEICGLITSFIQGLQLSGELAETKEAVIKNMPALQYGLDVDCGFTSCESFTKTEKSKIFELLNIRMLHGWLVNPRETQIAALIGNATYEELTLLLIASNEVQEKKEEKERRLSPDECLLVQHFLDSTSHQLTDYGLEMLHQTLKEGELAVFFRNNHFSTLTFHNGFLFNLVTDIGYERERNVVWDLLSEVNGNSQLFSGTFQSANEVKKQEVIDTALAFGFSKERVDKAIAAVYKPTEELKVDEVLEWLQKHFPM